ncbi:disks large-associated protein 5 isoform X1 [Hemiscyllium ocellatum]|uniref:disks large-associated protein 5 isoform X1 n=1 Tax=Hemiscyllium ocellatum TaxID=170820 RepID=UPI002967435A|nr:disks large-associated protein 5 isoform X1 [Hemiscyllium ocellatum]
MELGHNRFSERYKAAASRGVEALRVKQAQSRARSQKENRDRQLRKSRRFDALPLLALQEEGEAEEPRPPKSSETAVPSQITRLEMLRRYKEEKLMRKLKAERAKPKQIFKVGIYKPDATPFQSQNIKPKAQNVVPSSSDLRVTRSMAKKQELLLTKAPSVPKFTAPTKVGPVKGNVSSNKGSSTVVTGTRSQHRPIQAAASKVPIAREKKDVKAAPVKPLQTRGRLEPKTAPKVVKPLQVAKSQAAINKTKKMEKPGERSDCKQIVHDEPASIPCEEQDMEVTEKDQPPSCKEPIQPTENDTDTGLQIPPVMGTGRVGKRISFAPENYVFAPVAGLAELKFPPLSPRSVNNFFASCSWSPVEHMSKNNIDSSTTQNLVTRTRRSKLVTKFESEHLPEAKSDDPVSTVIEEVSASHKPQDSLASCTTDVSGPQHNVAYFRGIVKSETESLSVLCQQWEIWANSAEVPDHVKDLVRTTVGQARLLMAERFKQFNGLVDNCEFKTSEKEVTCTDLEGFWDMIYFQVEDVNKKFEYLKKLQENKWEEPNELLSVPKKMVKKKVAIAKPTEVIAIKANKTLAAPKSSLAALKASMKAKLKREMTGSNSQENQKDVIVFDAGFFRVESPAKSFTAPPNTTTVEDWASRQQAKEQCTPAKSACDSTAPTSPIPSMCDRPNQQTSDKKVLECLPEVESPVMKKDDNSSMAEESTAQETCCFQKRQEEVNTSLDFAKYLQPRSSVANLPEVLQSPFHDNGCDATSVCNKYSQHYNGKSEFASSLLSCDDVEMKSPVSQQSSIGAPEEAFQQTSTVDVTPTSISATQTPSFSSVNDLLVAGAVLRNVQSAGNCMSPFDTMVGAGDRHRLPLQIPLQDLISFSPSGTPQ